ncbi:MAG: hypothetical protein FJ390_02440 [Verrucomicrobia bacterium]|nr:hypothetical protein [Verrucomicrobiota bacterium]
MNAYTIFTHYLDYRACCNSLAPARLALAGLPSALDPAASQLAVFYWHLTALSSLTLQKIALVLPPFQFNKLYSPANS